MSSSSCIATAVPRSIILYELAKISTVAVGLFAALILHSDFTGSRTSLAGTFENSMLPVNVAFAVGLPLNSFESGPLEYDDKDSENEELEFVFLRFAGALTAS